MAFDEQFILGAESEPEIEACVMHPMLPSVRKINEEKTKDFAGVVYGLCIQCEDLLERFPRFQEMIDEEVDSRLTDLANKEQV